MFFFIAIEYSHHYHPYAHQKQLYGGPPPPLPPHHTHGGHGGHHPSHAHAHTHGPLHDENGVIANDPNDESATSDLATSYLAYRYLFTLLVRSSTCKNYNIKKNILVTMRPGFPKLTKLIVK